MNKVSKLNKDPGVSIEQGVSAGDHVIIVSWSQLNKESGVSIEQEVLAVQGVSWHYRTKGFI